MQKGSTSEPGGDHGRAVREHLKGTREHRRAEREPKYGVSFSAREMRRYPISETLGCYIYLYQFHGSCGFQALWIFLGREKS